MCPPSFWVEPTDEQKGNVLLDFHDTVVVTHESHVATGDVDPATDEHRWINARAKPSLRDYLSSEP